VHTKDIARLRRFNRRYITQLGLFARDDVGEGLSVSDLRVFFEIIDDPGLTARQLSADLDIDEGQISRILKRYIDMGWLTRKRSADDARRKQIEITSEGRKLYETLNARADEKTLLRLRGADPAAVANAMDGILDLLRPTEQTGVAIRDISFGDPGWVAQRHSETYSVDPGFSPEFELFVFDIMANFVRTKDPARERGFIAHRNGHRLGSIFCMAADVPDLAKLRLFFVEPTARGLGLGRRLMDDCLSFARGAGYKRMTLMTHETQSTARQLYVRYGFKCTSATPVHNFGRDALEEIWDVNL
jgi:DNA-binding MarR family transcriptional regulator/GNAT superfamily N-acetyltransferase